jgi:CBS-domain-containing membrane protein
LQNLNKNADSNSEKDDTFLNRLLKSKTTTSQPVAPALHGRDALFAQGLAVIYMGLISVLASGSGFALLFFPELAALSYDVFRRPLGAWARAPLLLILTPVTTAIVGVAVAKTLPFGLLAVLLAVGISIIIVHVLRSPIAPAISAGLLPVILHEDSWLYPPCILVGVVLLVGTSFIWQRYAVPRLPRTEATKREKADEATELIPRRRAWIPVLLAFVIVIVGLVQWTGLRLILFPPLVVIAYEMFGHPSVCPWARKPIRMPIACSLAAAGGAFFVISLGPGVLSTTLGMIWGILILHLFDLHVPPALAIALIPQIMHDLNYWYPISVAIGTSTLSACFIVYKSLLARHSRSQEAFDSVLDKSEL